MPCISITPELRLRYDKVRARMGSAPALVISDLANIYYLTGLVFRGYIYVPAEGDPVIMPIRPIGLEGECVHYVRKPEQIPDVLASLGLELPLQMGLELDDLSYSDVSRLQKALGVVTTLNASPMLKRARMVKTPYEIEQIAECGAAHCAAYADFTALYRDGMTDTEFQIEMERVLRLHGGLGFTRTSGPLMEINMGSVLTGDNADAPTPYEFSLGGAGADPSLPVGATGTAIRRGATIMVDMSGHFNGYQSDLSRVWALGPVPDEALRAHEVSVAICRKIEEIAVEGLPVAELYAAALQMAVDAGLKDYFMGHTQQVPFIGHGVGIQLNELPVLTPRSKDLLEPGMVIALEPKFVIPGVGAVGIENTYAVLPSGLRNLTPYPDAIQMLNA